MAKGFRSPTDDNLTVPEVCEKLRCSVETLRKMRDRGDGPPFMRLTAGGRILYPLQEYETWRRARASADTKAAIAPEPPADDADAP